MQAWGARLFGVVLVLGTATSVFGQLAFPQGTQNFETLSVGQSIDVLSDFPLIVNESGAAFTILGADDVNGNMSPRGTSTRWVRVTDTAGGNVQNRFYSLGIVAPQDMHYEWDFYINLEATPPVSPTVTPKITIQHRDNSNVYQNAWGVEFTGSGANLIVLGIGGVSSSAPLYSLSGPTAVGEWVHLKLRVRFDKNVLSASVNGGNDVKLPINLNGNKRDFRFCYRGEGTGNINRMLIDDVTVVVGGPIPTITTAGMGVMAVLVLAAAGIVVRRWKRFPGYVAA